MAILPVSLVKNNYSRQNLSFGQRSTADDPIEQHEDKKAGSMVTIPTALFIALATTALSNGVKAETVSEENVVPNTEMLIQTPDRPLFYFPKAIKYTKRFKMDGKNYTMVYIDELYKDRDPSKKVITKIAFVPDGFTKQIPGSAGTREPMVLNTLIYHALGPEKAFIGAYVIERYDTPNKFIKKAKEIRLPDNIGDELIDLFARKTGFKYVKENNYTETSSPKLIPPSEY